MELCQDMDCKVTASRRRDSMTSLMTGSGISLRVYGSDMEDLQAAAETWRRLGSVEGAAGSFRWPDACGPAVHLTVDRLRPWRRA